MAEFMRAGGFVMWVVLLFGGVTLGASLLFAWRPDEGKIGFIKAMTVATVFSVLSAIAADFGAVMSKVPKHPEWSKSPEIHLIVMTGLGESTAPAILGFTILSLVWVVTAVGIRKLSYNVL